MVHEDFAFGTIAARNVGTRTCTITGYPGFLVMTGGPDPTATTLTRAYGSVPHTVTLQVGASASFGFSHKTYANGAHCDAVTAARIFDPDGSGYQTTDTMFRECEGITAAGLRPVPVTVGPFQAGTKASLA